MKKLLFIALASGLCTNLGSAPSHGPIAGPCYLSVNVPVGATLLVNGARTAQMTAQRSFISPPLPMGETFYYTFTASYTASGEMMTRQQQVAVTAGANVVLDMTLAESVANAVPKQPDGGAPFAAPDQPEAAAKPTPPVVIAEMIKLANLKNGERVLDFGNGDANPAIAEGARKVREVTVVSIRPGTALTEQSFAAADVVFLRLSPEANRKVKPLLLKWLQPGARIVSHDFDLDDWEVDKSVTVVDDKDIAHQVYSWTIPKK